MSVESNHIVTNTLRTHQSVTRVTARTRPTCQRQGHHTHCLLATHKYEMSSPSRCISTARLSKGKKKKSILQSMKCSICIERIVNSSLNALHPCPLNKVVYGSELSPQAG